MRGAKLFANARFWSATLLSFGTTREKEYAKVDVVLNVCSG